MKKVVNYKVQKEEWENAKNDAFKKVNAKYTIDGFRKGKAPRKMFEKAYPGKIVTEAADMLIDKEYRRLIIEEKIMPVVEPKIDLVKLTDEEFEANFTFILEPTVELGEYKNLGIKKKAVKVTEDEIKKEINNVLKNYTELVIKEKGKVESGDIAIIDFEGFKDEVAFEGGKGENYSLEIGSNSFIPGFEDGIIGMKKGEEKDLNLKFPEEYGAADLAGAEVVFKVKVNEIKTKQIPELNKEFFEDLAMENVNDEESLNKEIKAQIKARKEEEADREYNDSLIAKVVENAKIDIEEEIIDAEANYMYESFMRDMQARGINEALYLQYTNTTKETIVNDMKKEAEKRLKNSYVLNAIIAKEEIKASEEEANKEIETMATKYKITTEEVIKEIGGKESMMRELQVRKALEVIASEK